MHVVTNVSNVYILILSVATLATYNATSIDGQSATCMCWRPEKNIIYL